jgi:hypothetical protein
MKQKGITSIAIIGTVILFLITAGGLGYYLVDKNNQNQKNQQHLSQNNNSEENLEILLQNYCTSYEQEYEGVREKLELGNYYYFNFNEPNDAIVGLCKHNYPTDKDNQMLFVLKNNNSELEEIFKYTNSDLGNYGMVRYPFTDIKILDINNDNKNELVFYSKDAGGSNSGVTHMIYLLYPQTKEIYHLFRYTNSSGPNEEVQLKNFYSNNLDSIENKENKDFLTSLMDEWFISIYGDKNGFYIDKETKEYFHPTEIVNNNLPHSIEFWTEAYCPNDGTKYDYIIPLGYSLFSCDKDNQEKGTHGGCPTCIMSKIKLIKIESIYNDHNTDFVCSPSEECPAMKITEVSDAKLMDLGQGLSSKIIESNELLKNYIEEKTGKIFKEIIVERGSFDRYLEGPVTLISLCKDNCKINFEDSLNGLDFVENKGFNDFFIITKIENNNFNVFYFSTHSIVRNANNFSIKPIIISNNEKPIFIGRSYGCGSTSWVGCNSYYYLFVIKNGELLPLQEIISDHEGFTYTDDGNEIYKAEIVKQIKFEDIDKDGFKEMLIEMENSIGEDPHKMNSTQSQIILKWNQRFYQVND